MALCTISSPSSDQGAPPALCPGINPGGAQVVPEIKLRLATCKVSALAADSSSLIIVIIISHAWWQCTITLPVVLSLWPPTLPNLKMGNFPIGIPYNEVHSKSKDRNSKIENVDLSIHQTPPLLLALPLFTLRIPAAWAGEVAQEGKYLLCMQLWRLQPRFESSWTSGMVP